MAAYTAVLDAEDFDYATGNESYVAIRNHPMYAETSVDGEGPPGSPEGVWAILGS
jgi:hypothetical protein